MLLLEGLLDGLLSLLPLRRLLEGVVVDNTLQALHFQGVTGGHQVVEVDDLDERLDLGALGDPLLTHAAGDLEGVALDTGDQGVAEGVGLAAVVHHLDDDDLLSGKSAPGDDSNPTVLEELHFEQTPAAG